jgi:alkyl hydroperoxide reductase subunit AhpC
MSGIQVGQTVPDFKLATFDPKTNDFGEFSLEENMKNGKWTVLFFYPADFTFVCATEFNALAGLQDEFEELGATLLTVSTDTQFTHLAWQREEKQLGGVKYFMGADPSGDVSNLFGVKLDNGLALRGTFLVNPEGTLMNAEVNFLNLGRNVGELMRKLKGNLYLAQNGAEACPATWTESGDKTLTPSAAMVGRVDQAING